MSDVIATLILLLGLGGIMLAVLGSIYVEARRRRDRKAFNDVEGENP
jgi:hypothetical protein